VLPARGFVHLSSFEKRSRRRSPRHANNRRQRGPSNESSPVSEADLNVGGFPNIVEKDAHAKVGEAPAGSPSSIEPVVKSITSPPGKLRGCSQPSSRRFPPGLVEGVPFASSNSNARRAAPSAEHLLVIAHRADARRHLADFHHIACGWRTTYRISISKPNRDAKRTARSIREFVFR